MTTTTTITIDKKRSKYRNKPNQNDNKKFVSKSIDEASEEVKSTEVKKREKPRKSTAEPVRKMFVSTIDPYDAPLTWWETEHVKYAINYPPVKSRLERIMGTHIVRLTDRKYMQHFMATIKEYKEKRQKIRIEERMLSPPSVISRVLQLSYNTLAEKLKEPGFNKLKLYL